MGAAGIDGKVVHGAGQLLSQDGGGPVPAGPGLGEISGIAFPVPL
jgi:hypothetical protein